MQQRYSEMMAYWELMKNQEHFCFFNLRVIILFGKGLITHLHSREHCRVFLPLVLPWISQFQNTCRILVCTASHFWAGRQHCLRLPRDRDTSPDFPNTGGVWRSQWMSHITICEIQVILTKKLWCWSLTVNKEFIQMVFFSSLLCGGT